jgi:hypothetical protein
MKKNRTLPIPFVVVMLAGLVSLFSILADRRSRVGTVRDDSLQVQTVEQERMAAIYFRILSWLTDIARGVSAPAKSPQAAPAPRVINTPRRHERRERMELCALPGENNFVARNPRTHKLN